MNSGYRLKSQEMEIPITFAESRQAHTFLNEIRIHGGICWTRSIADDLKGGYDAYLIWQLGLPRFGALIPLLHSSPSSSSRNPFGITCERHEGYEYEQDDKNGPVYLRDSSSTLLTFDTKEKAQRAYSDLSPGPGAQAADLCEISISDAVGNKTHPVVAFRGD